MLIAMLTMCDTHYRPAFQQRRSHGYKEDPYVFLPRDNEVQEAVA